ncbi:MAG: type II secretion system protein [Planctomycetota bacterium]|nr:type II secretion system protein [Planctomycetota bacterium]
MNRNNNSSGFTLIEILVAMLITSIIMITVSTTLISTMGARKKVGALTESTEAGSRILNLLERDLDGLWTHNIKDNRVLIGRNMDLAGPPADRLDFITNTDSITAIEKTDETLAHASVCEVGYWLRSNPKDPLLMELWRREDPMVDDDLVRGGTFQLIHNRIREFNIIYYKSPGKEAEEFNDWDSSTEDSLPRVIKIEFTIERKLSGAEVTQSAEVEDFENNNKKYTRYIVLDKEFSKILEPNLAMIPVLPSEPTADDAGGDDSEGAKAGPAGGPAGPAGRGRDKDGNTLTSEEIDLAGGRKRGDRGGRSGSGGNRGGGLPPGFGNRGGGMDLNQLFKNLGGGSSGGGFGGFGGLGNGR